MEARQCPEPRVSLSGQDGGAAGAGSWAGFGSLPEHSAPHKSHSGRIGERECSWKPKALLPDLPCHHRNVVGLGRLQQVRADEWEPD